MRKNMHKYTRHKCLLYGTSHLYSYAVIEKLQHLMRFKKRPI